MKITNDAGREAFALIDDNGLEFEPWASDLFGHVMVGYRLKHPDGSVSYIYFNPSTSDGAHESNVFVYQGEDGDPSVDEASHHYVIPVKGTETA